MTKPNAITRLIAHILPKPTPIPREQATEPVFDIVVNLVKSLSLDVIAEMTNISRQDAERHYRHSIESHAKLLKILVLSEQAVVDSADALQAEGTSLNSQEIGREEWDRLAANNADVQSVLINQFPYAMSHSPTMRAIILGANMSVTTEAFRGVSAIDKAKWAKAIADSE